MVKGVLVGDLWRDKLRNFWHKYYHSTRRWRELALVSRRGANTAVFWHKYYHSIRRWRELGLELGLASWGGINAAIFGTNTTTVRGGEGSWRWILTEGPTPWFLAQILPWYENKKGVSQRWRLTEGKMSWFLAQDMVSRGGPRMTKNTVVCV